MEKKTVTKKVPIRQLIDKEVDEYIAIDGTSFDTEQECIAHELKLEEHRQFLIKQEELINKYHIKDCPHTVFDIDQLDNSMILYVPENTLLTTLIEDLISLAYITNNEVYLHNVNVFADPNYKTSIFPEGDYMVMCNYDDSDYPDYYTQIYSLDKLITKLENQIELIKSKYERKQK